MYTLSRKSTDLSNIVVHVVSGDKLRWPPPISDLASFLTASDHLEHIESTSLQGERSVDDVTDPLHVLPSGLLQDVRRLAATLQDMASRDVPGFSSPKTSILASIVATVMRHCAPDAFIMERPCFATARPPRPDYRNLAPYFPMQERATLLVMHAVVEFSDHLKKAKGVGEGDTLGDGSSDLSCAGNAVVNGRNSHEEVVNGSVAEDDAVSEDDEDEAYSYCESPPSPRRYTAEELAAGGYFSEYDEVRTIRTLYGQGTSPALVPPVTDYIALTYLSPAFQTSPPAIPIVCMADYTTIFSLLKSAVYQRRAWGICEPVVGLAFEPADRVVQFVFAWADEMENNGLPVVHMAMCDPDHAHDPSSGVFDVSEACSMIDLVHCFVNLRGHVTRLQSAASSNVERAVASVLAEHTLDWRFDLSGHTDGAVGGLDNSARIRAWFKNVSSGPNSEAASASSSFPSPHYTDMPPRRDQARSKTSKPSQDDGGQSTKPLPTEQEPVSHEPTGAPSLVVSDHDSNNMVPPPTDASSNRVKRYSCSAFAAGGDEQDPNLLTDRWLADRTATRHTLLPLTGNFEVPQQYRKFTQFMWPTDWTALAHLPNVDQSYDSFKEELFASAVAKIEEVDKPGEELSSDIVHDLRVGFATVLQACKRARDLKEDAKRHDIPEIECRHEWDSLIIEFVKGKNNVGAWLERTIKMPRNSRADHPEDNDFLQNQERSFRAYNASQLAIIQALENSQSTDLRKQEEAVLNSIVYRMNLGAEWANSRVDLDPSTGKCDALAGVEVRDFMASDAKFGLKQVLKGFAFTSRMQPHARRMKTTSSKTASPKYLELPTRSSSEVRDKPPLVEKAPLESTPAYHLFHRNFQSEDVYNLECASHEDITSKLQQLSLDSSPVDEPITKDPGFSLDLPLFVVEYKKIQTDFTVTGANQHRMYSTAAVSFLAAVGIMQFPIFSLLTDGCRGIITCTWAETNQGVRCVRIAERNGVDFDLSDSLSAFRFAVFLCKLAREHSKNLLAAFMEVKDKLLQRLQEKNPDTHWSLASQIDDLKKASK